MIVAPFFQTQSVSTWPGPWVWLAAANREKCQVSTNINKNLLYQI
jgi:hypothetical protein